VARPPLVRPPRHLRPGLARRTPLPRCSGAE
jgi:hypothetical protein